MKIFGQIILDLSGTNLNLKYLVLFTEISKKVRLVTHYYIDSLENHSNAAEILEYSQTSFLNNILNLLKFHMLRLLTTE